MKGMRDIIGDEFYKYEGFFERASEIALYYGFTPIETPILEKEELFSTSVGAGTDIVEKEMYGIRTKGGDRLVMRPEGTASILRSYLEHGMQSMPQPVMAYYKGPYFRHESPQRGRFRQFYQFGLEMLGTSKSIADATIIHCVSTIVRESGIEGVVIEINSIGDKECRPKFVRELVTYYKKHISHLCPDCKRRLKENPLRLLDCKNEKCVELKDEAPKSVTHLCDECRKHFKEVLEYLEALAVPYRMNHNLVRGIDYYTRTVFEIVAEKVVTEETDADKKEGEEKKEVEEKKIVVPGLSLGGGGRYDYLAKVLGSKKDVSGVGASLGVDRIIMSENYDYHKPRILKQPKFYFIQLGFDAKLKSLSIIEILRKAKVPVLQTLAKDSLGTQLGIAEKLRIPYTLIFGQKESLDDTVIVRDMSTRSQETIKLADLSKHIKGLK